MTRQKRLQGMEIDKNIFACMNNFVHNMIACEQALLGVTRGYNKILYCRKSDHQSKKSKVWFFLVAHLWKVQEMLIKQFFLS